jgi:hypothetical protein
MTERVRTEVVAYKGSAHKVMDWRAAYSLVGRRNRTNERGRRESERVVMVVAESDGYAAVNRVTHCCRLALFGNGIKASVVRAQPRVSTRWFKR